MVELVDALQQLVVAIGHIGPLGVAALALLVALSAVNKSGGTR